MKRIVAVIVAIAIMVLSAPIISAGERAENLPKVGDYLQLPALYFLSGGELSLEKDPAYVRIWPTKTNVKNRVLVLTKKRDKARFIPF